MSQSFNYRKYFFKRQSLFKRQHTLLLLVGTICRQSHQRRHYGYNAISLTKVSRELINLPAVQYYSPFLVGLPCLLTAKCRVDTFDSLATGVVFVYGDLYSASVADVPTSRTYNELRQFMKTCNAVNKSLGCIT